MLKKPYRHFSKPINLALLNAVFIAVIVLFNLYFQAFCIPVNWAIVVVCICFANTILYPLLENTKWSLLTGFVNGISLFVFVYCILFFEHANLLGILIIGFGLPVYIPHFFVVQIILKTVRSRNRPAKYMFLLAMAFCTGAVAYVGSQYKKAIVSIEEFEKSGYTVLEKNYMTEKILGMHFIYHTRFCEYDGWRPPKHDPALVIGMWLNGRRDPLNVDLSMRLELYKKFFPKNRYKFDCSCAKCRKHHLSQ